MDPNDDPKKRLHLNLAGGYNNDRNYQPTNDRIFPTTPSTFPQPVYGAQGATTPNVYANAPVPSPYGATQAGGYFPQSNQNQQATYQNQQASYQNQQASYQYQNQYQQQSLAAPLPSFQQRQTGYNVNDPNSTLAHQFSNQNLGTPQRQGSPFGRQPSPSSRIHPGGQPYQPPQVRGQHLSNQPTRPTLLTPPATNPSSQSMSPTDEQPPEKNPDKYSSNIVKRGDVLHALVQAFFKENITRARDRNKRARELDDLMKNAGITEALKKQQANDTRKAETQYLRYLRTKESPNNFTTMKIIGKGAFGEVKLVQRKTDGKIYALKSLVKTEMFKKDQLAHVRAERDILAESDTPWVVKLHTTFQDPTYLYMLMEFLPGGDLMTMLIKYEIFSIQITRFYIAQIIMAIEAVHSQGYIHRDIKPDNILLDRYGHVKLTDFGLSTGFHKQHDNSYYQNLLKGKSNKKNNRNSVSLDQINLTISNRSQINTWRSSRRVLAYSTVGTPDYIAPEIFTGQGYSFGCDWWSVGAIMYECLIGWPPFCAEDAHDTYRKIVNWRNTLYFPEDNPLMNENPQQPGGPQWPNAESCITSLLCDVNDRLGTNSGQNGAAEIKEHPFFRGVVWETLRNMRAPFRPELSSNVDTAYFPVNEIDQTDNSSAHRAQVDALGDEHSAELSLPFIGYTYKAFDSMRNA